MVGDFGTIDPRTGEFQREGNVFEHPASKEIMPEHNPITNASTVHHTYIIKHTKNVSQIDVPLGGGVGLTGIAAGNVTAQFRFGSERGVLLFMRDVTFTTFPIGKPWASKLEEHTSFFKRKAIVTETYSCRHYDLRMDRGGEHSVDITGTVEVPIPAAPALSASVNVGFKTASKAGFKFELQGTKNETESDGFVPMYRLKGFSSGRLCSIYPPDEEILDDIQPPGFKGVFVKSGETGYMSSSDEASKEENNEESSWEFVFSSDEDGTSEEEESNEEEGSEEDV